MRTRIIVFILILGLISAILIPDFDNDGLPTWKELFDDHTDPFKKDLAFVYAVSSGFPTEFSRSFSTFDIDEIFDANEQDIIDFVKELGEKHIQQKVVDEFAADGKASSEEINQIKFLKSFSKTEQTEFIQNGKFTDFDWDTDLMSNYFEKFIADLPYDVKNDRYFVHVFTHPKDTFSPEGTFSPEIWKFVTSDRYKLLMKYKFHPFNIMILWGNEATKENFREVILDLSEKVDKNSIVFIVIEGHGGPGVFAFNDGFGENQGKGSIRMFYVDMDELFDKINSKYLQINNAACDAGLPASLDPISEGPCPRLAMGPYSLFSFLSWAETRNNLRDMDSNSDGYLSVEEYYNFLQLHEQLPWTNIRDSSDIFSKIHLGEATLEKLEGYINQTDQNFYQSFYTE